MICTTLRRVICEARYNKTFSLNRLRGGLGEGWELDAQVPFADIVKMNGLDDALWCCRVEPQYAKEWRLYSAWCARQVQHLFRSSWPSSAIEAAEKYAHGQMADAELLRLYEESQQQENGVDHELMLATDLLEPDASEAIYNAPYTAKKIAGCDGWFQALEQTEQFIKMVSGGQS